MRSTYLSALALFFLLSPCTLTAVAQDQQTPPPKQAESQAPAGSYKLSFVVTELSKGKVEGRRTFTSLFAPVSSQSGSIRSGSKIPVATGSIASGDASKIVNTQIQYIDVGANFDFRQIPNLQIKLQEGELALDIGASISSYVKSDGSQVNEPIIQQNKWESVFIISLNKPKLLFSSDDPHTDQTTQVELTVTRVSP